MSTEEKQKREYSLSTLLVNGTHKDQYKASVAPAYISATFKPNSLSDMGDYDYTRSGNPTRTNVQAHLAKVIKCDYVFAVNSGMAALDVIVRTVKPGDEVIAGDDLYGGTHRLLTYLKEKDGVDLKHHDTTDLDIMKSAITEKTKMVFLESPTNPLIKVIDLKAICDHAHKVNPDCVVVFDNTMMSPILMSPLELGVDIQYESATKYMNGHHDIMAGVVATNRKDLAEKVFFVINATGAGLAPFDSWLLLRGLKTLGLRIERQQQSAMIIAEWLENKGFKVRYPGLKSHPQYDLHKSYCKGPGGVLSFETGDVKLSERIIEACELFSVTVSFGCVNSLISLPCKMSHASIDEKVRKERDFPEDLIRLCIGIEDVEDLKYDLEEAFKAAAL